MKSHLKMMKNEDMHGILTRSPSGELSSLETTEYLDISEYFYVKSRAHGHSRDSHMTSEKRLEAIV